MAASDKDTLPREGARDEVRGNAVSPAIYGGRYSVERLLRDGGQSRVLRASDLKIGRTVALKIILPGRKPTQQQRLRFEQEARAAGGLNHPNILVVFDVGEHDDDPYIVT